VHYPQADFSLIDMLGHDENDDAAVLLAKLRVSNAMVIDGVQAVSKHDQEISSVGRSSRDGCGIPRRRQESLNLTGSDRESDLDAPLDIAFNVAERDRSRYFGCLHQGFSEQGRKYCAESIAGQHSRYVILATFSDTDGDEPHQMSVGHDHFSELGSASDCRRVAFKDQDHESDVRLHQQVLKGSELVNKRSI